MPLRQPPAEQPFSLIPPNWNPVSNDRVLPHLGPNHSAFDSGKLFLPFSFALTSGQYGTIPACPVRWRSPLRRSEGRILSL